MNEAADAVAQTAAQALLSVAVVVHIAFKGESDHAQYTAMVAQVL